MHHLQHLLRKWSFTDTVAATKNAPDVSEAFSVRLAAISVSAMPACFADP
jgi:hypothetical protein